MASNGTALPVGLQGPAPAPPKAPPPRHLLQTPLLKATEKATLFANISRFGRAHDLQPSTVEALRKLRPEVAEELMNDMPGRLTNADAYVRDRARLAAQSAQDFGLATNLASTVQNDAPFPSLKQAQHAVVRAAAAERMRVLGASSGPSAVPAASKGAPDVVSPQKSVPDSDVHAESKSAESDGAPAKAEEKKASKWSEAHREVAQLLLDNEKKNSTSRTDDSRWVPASAMADPADKKKSPELSPFTPSDAEASGGMPVPKPFSGPAVNGGAWMASSIGFANPWGNPWAMYAAANHYAALYQSVNKKKKKKKSKGKKRSRSSSSSSCSVKVAAKSSVVSAVKSTVASKSGRRSEAPSTGSKASVPVPAARSAPKSRERNSRLPEDGGCTADSSLTDSLRNISDWSPLREVSPEQPRSIPEQPPQRESIGGVSEWTPLAENSQLQRPIHIGTPVQITSDARTGNPPNSNLWERGRKLDGGVWAEPPVRNDEPDRSAAQTVAIDTAVAGRETEGQWPEGSPERRLHGWLMELDGGRGVLLQYFDALRQEFSSDLSRIREMRLSTPRAPGIMGTIDAYFWELCGVKQMGHRLLFAKGINTLE